MDEKTELLICLGASTAANCVPCFEHYFRKAAGIGLTPEEIQRAVELASKVENGAHGMMRGSIRNIMGHDSGADDAACPSSGSTCCG
jgi:alkylhydroperoxidase/carboxymuconolactone decarboxylase family protein YurZ